MGRPKKSPMTEENTNPSSENMDTASESASAQSIEQMMPTEPEMPVTKPAIDRNMLAVREAEMNLDERAKQIRDAWSKEPRVRMNIPLMPGEAKNSYETVQVNGYRLEIRKGIVVELPESAAKILSDHLNIDLNIGTDKLAGRDNKTAEALSA